MAGVFLASRTHKAQPHCSPGKSDKARILDFHLASYFRIIQTIGRAVGEPAKLGLLCKKCWGWASSKAGIA